MRARQFIPQLQYGEAHLVAEPHPPSGTGWRPDAPKAGTSRADGHWQENLRPKHTQFFFFFSQSGEALELPLNWASCVKASAGLWHFRIYLTVICSWGHNKLCWQSQAREFSGPGNITSGMCCIHLWAAKARAQKQPVPEPYPRTKLHLAYSETLRMGGVSFLAAAKLIWKTWCNLTPNKEHPKCLENVALTVFEINTKNIISKSTTCLWREEIITYI